MNPKPPKKISKLTKMTNNIITSFSLLLSLIPFTSPTTITLPLTHFKKIPKTQNIYEHFNHLADTSLTRAHHLKIPNPSKSTTTAASETPVSPRSYGAYSIDLNIGTPPQKLSFLMDTGSSFVWFPCTHKYTCKNCSFTSSSSKTKPPHIPFFVPKLSSAAKLVGCLNQKCGWIHNPDTRTRCQDCSLASSNCTQQLCRPYLILYGSGTTGGLALLDTLNLNTKLKIPDFLVGCSIFSSHQPVGIAGFGRGDSSLPSQLGLTKFSYCSLPHTFDDTRVTSALNLTRNGTSVRKLDGVSYTPFLANPRVPTKESFSKYYYVGLNKILLNGQKVKFAGDFLSPPDAVTGYGGTIVDSGTSLTYMSREVFEPLAREFEKQMKLYKRTEVIELKTGMRPCFNISGYKTVSFPSLMFHFKGEAKMELPVQNYFSLVGDEEVVCLTIVTDQPGRYTVSGPRVILGNYQQQNFYVEYDLKHNRFGFKQRKCV